MAISISTEPKQGVEEELVARLDPLGAAPDADDQVHRDQAAFEEDVEQEQVLRGEGAHDQRLHQQEIGHVLGHALRDRAPARADADRHQEGGEHDQHERDAVDPERPVDSAAKGVAFDELPLRAVGIELDPEVNAERKVDQRSRSAQSSARRPP